MTIAEDAIERLCEITETRGYDVDNLDPGHVWVDGYTEGHRAARNDHAALVDACRTYFNSGTNNPDPIRQALHTLDRNR